MSKTTQDHLFAGICNMLVNCADCSFGQTLLVVHEKSGEQYYDPGLLHAVTDASRRLGLLPELYEVPFVREVKDPDQKLSAKIRATDHTLFLARLGDQIRFRSNGLPGTQIVCYALDRAMLASNFGTAHHRAFETLKDLINHALTQAREIHVTCPAGTDFSGGPVVYDPQGGDVSIKRFPVSVFTPAPAIGFRGRVAQVGFLVGTGSQYYQPYACALSETLFVEFEGNRITGFDGSTQDVAAARAHYEFVGNKFGIDPYFVHSWHAGMHPGCDFLEPAAEDFGRWSGGAFGNPRLLHFHTCGEYPPGEISLNIVDPTVRLDGVAVWENGVLHPERLVGGAALLDEYPCAAAAFRAPAQNIGLGAGGQLSFDKNVVSNA